MKRAFSVLGSLAITAFLVSSASATLISVTGGTSNLGTLPSIISAPAHLLDDTATNTGMQGFDEAQGVVTTVAHTIDGGGSIAAGSLVDSHMIFLNSAGGTFLTHYSVEWTFSGAILGIMSNRSGTYEANSTFELGAPGSNYTTTFAGSGPAAPFSARGLESHGSGTSGDGYTITAANSLLVGMAVSEPGDWIRVVTTSSVPEPSTLLMLGSGLAGLGLAGWRKRKKA